MDVERLLAFPDLVGEEFFSPGELQEIEELRKSEAWVDWREVRSDV